MGVPIPKPSYLSAFCVSIGTRNGERRWKNIEGTRLYTWDYLHGEIEVWNLRGDHLGALDPVSGDRIKMADPRKSLDVK